VVRRSASRPGVILQVRHAWKQYLLWYLQGFSTGRCNWPAARIRREEVLGIVFSTVGQRLVSFSSRDVSTQSTLQPTRDKSTWHPAFRGTTCLTKSGNRTQDTRIQIVWLPSKSYQMCTSIERRCELCGVALVFLRSRIRPSIRTDFGFCRFRTLRRCPRPSSTTTCATP
jgi:hypothetical protein